MRSILSNQRILIIVYLLAIVLTFLVKENCFFWDTVQFGSIHPHFYLENNFSSFFLPESMDSGHPPTFGIYIALVWKIFGKTLAVSHFAMLPFLMGIIFYLNLLGKYFFKNSLFLSAFVLLHVFDPCLAGHAAFVSPDILVVLFFLMSFYGILNQKKIHLLIGVLGLCLMSTRGMMTVAALFIFDFINYIWIEKNKVSFLNLFYKTLPYALGGILGICFLISHYYHTGWIGYHENSPWSPSFDKMDATGVIKNILVLGWRLLDFGRVFLWLVLFFISFKIFRKKIKFDQKSWQLMVLLILLVIFLMPPMVIHKMLSGHRYLFPIILIFNSLVLYFIFKYSETRPLRKVLFLIAFLGLSLGNFWVYPRQIAQNWDTTLAVQPYFELRKKMLQFIDDNKIPVEAIGSTFPNIQSFKFLDLTEDKRKFSEKNFQQQEYIYYSNVFNDFTDEEIEALETDWIVLKSFERMNIEVVLYKKGE